MMVTNFTNFKPIDKLLSTSKPLPTVHFYFVQVGAFRNQPSQKYLHKIQKSGYNYILKNETIKGIEYIKVLIGPYASIKLAKKELSFIKSKLGEKNAFIKKL